MKRGKGRPFEKGSKHILWKGGRFPSTNGYIWVWNPTHPLASKVSPVGYVYEHRLVMESMIGRYLQKGEIVHHKNHVRHDNRPENLQLMSSGENVAEANGKRIHTEQSKKKHREVALKRKRNNLGRFI